ncbi:energy-coupling factor transport system ATP-binding protein [Arthrobacter silviterrae]|uniref:ABC transporter ATP-binding protein n=1 Tax=Arthrobacter silviterrae TaxID=2026658 RepID=A0ABX0DH39_9MICC|nr:ABC transporter ATP-binding protein [Arthrobacter silviterrae]MDQ0276478.1 energy-coupling factor transport system ATP-binding protein [Arthrobacter silviterrae]NGN84684.1 ABC transporter ATP-binding protein [Arthrobacter silviterrae]
MELVSLRNVGFTYAYGDKPALNDVSLTIEPGLLYGVVGLNASGKSTLCSVVRGIIPHFHHGELTGEVKIKGRDLLEWDPAELSKSIGYVFQNPFTQISGVKDTVFEEIALGLENLGVDREEMIDRVTTVVRELGLEALIRKNPNELSGGQRQKVAFASIIAMDADFIIIDEPTSQLDPDASEAVFGIIRKLKERGKSIILVEHKIDLMAEYADRIIVMKAGRVVMEGPAREVLVSDELSQAGVPYPEVTELAFALANAGKPLRSVPITRAEARELVSARIKEAPHAHSAL